MHDAELLVPITLFVAIAVILWKFLENSHQQKMTMIERGMIPGSRKQERRARDPLSALKWGLIGAFVGGGLLGGLVLADFFDLNEGVVPAMALLMGGLALVIYYLLAIKKSRDEVHIEF